MERLVLNRVRVEQCSIRKCFGEIKLTPEMGVSDLEGTLDGSIIVQVEGVLLDNIATNLFVFVPLFNSN